MTINILVLEGNLNGKIVVVRFFFCWVYKHPGSNNEREVCVTSPKTDFSICDLNISIGYCNL